MPGLPALPVHKALLDPKVHKGYKARKDPSGQLVPPEPPVPRAFKDLLVLPALPAHKALLVPKAHKEYKARKDPSDRPVPPELPVPRAFKDLPGQPALPALLGPRDLKGLRVPLGLLVRQGLRASKVSKALPAYKAHRALPDPLVLPVPPAPLPAV